MQEKEVRPGTDGVAVSTKMGRGTSAPYANGGSGTIWALSPPHAEPAHHAGPYAVGHGNIGSQHLNDTRASGNQGMVDTITRMVYLNYLHNTHVGQPKPQKLTGMQDVHKNINSY